MFVFLASPAMAKTNVLQDINMYYTGNSFEKGYLLCKYSRKDFKLSYVAVGGIPIIQQPSPGFERDYDLVAHLQGLQLPLAPDEFASLYQKADDDQQRMKVFNLLARLNKDAARLTAEKLITVICNQGGRRVAISIERFKALLTAINGSDNRLIANGLVKSFLEQAVKQVRDLEGLDDLIELAAANDAFEILRQPTTEVLKTIPSRLSFSDTVYAARIYFRIDKDMARKYFNEIRFDFQNFLATPILTQKIAGLMQELSGVAAFRPLYETDALYKSLQKQPNETRIRVTGLFDNVDPDLASVASNSIGRDAKDLVFRTPGVLELLAQLTAKYNKNNVSDLVNALTRTVVERTVPYTLDNLFDAVRTMDEKPEAFIESVLTYDLNSGLRANRNGSLILSLINALEPRQLPVFEEYFTKKTSLAKGILTILFLKDKTAFHKLLAHVFANDPAAIADLQLPNDIFDLKRVAPAFSMKAIKKFDTLPASLFFAQHELAGNNADITLVRRALIPELNHLFNHFLSMDPKELTETQAIETFLLLSLVSEPGGKAFQKEHFVLDKLLHDYFSGAMTNGNTLLKSQIAQKEKRLAGILRHLDLKKSVNHLSAWLRIYSFLISLYLVAGAILSLFYACNRLVPGKNFSLINGTLHFLESFSCYLMATVISLIAGFLLKCLTQFLRGLLAKESDTPDMQECLAMLQGDENAEIASNNA